MEEIPPSEFDDYYGLVRGLLLIGGMWITIPDNERQTTGASMYVCM
jgi:hypothetical protein